MGTRDKHEPGTFSWVDLATTDLDGAKAFYAEVFGWDYEDNPVGDDQVYSMATLDGRHAAGLSEADGPPRWNSYVTVESADDAAKKAEEAGANVHAPPFDVMDAGRMAVIQDPSGGVVSLWEAKDNPGAGVVNTHGSLTWNDLQTHDVAKATEFYCELFGWEVAPVDEDAGNERVVIRNGERMNGGMAKLPESAGEEVPPHWLPYFAVDDLDAATGKVEQGGGTVMAGPIEVPSGRIAVIADPQGAVFGLVDGEMDD
jgi:predicted enzyme related to lactoylglutathione lyase